MGEFSRDVFLSYNWLIKKQVEMLDNELMSMGLKTWRDDSDLFMSNVPLSAQLSTAIDESKIFVCFITTGYCKSKFCNQEFEFANRSNKCMIVLMIENLKPNTICKIPVSGTKHKSGIGFILR